MSDPQFAQKPLTAEAGAGPQVAGIRDEGSPARLQSAELIAADASLAKNAPGPEPAAAQPVTEDQLNLIANLFQMIIQQQVRAITNVQSTIKEEDPPSILEAVVSVLGAAALGGTFGFIGGLVGSLGAALAKSRNLSTHLVQAVAEGFSDAAKAGLEAAISQGHQMVAAETQDPVERFFRAQVNALVEISDLQRIAFDETHRGLIRNAAKPYEEAQAIIDALKQARTSAYADQRGRILDAWVTAQAHSEVGITADAVTLAQGKPADQAVGTFLGDEAAEPSADYVLNVNVELSRPGDAVTIESATLSGTNESVRNLIASRPMKDLDIPLVVHGNTAEGTVRVARNEGGVVWNRSDPKGSTWLGARAKLEEGGAGGAGLQPDTCAPAPAIMTTFFNTPLLLKPVDGKDAENGARILIEKDMKDLMISPARMEK